MAALLRSIFTLSMVLVAFWGTTALAERPERSTASLQRVAAALEATLNIYRLSLLEVVPTARLIHARGQVSGAMPNTRLPASALEVFGRLATSVPSRVPKDALPPIARHFHGEAKNALEMLASSATLGEVLPHMQRLQRALLRLNSIGSQVVELLGEEGRVSADIFDADETLDAIGESLDELARAERQIGQLRQQKASLGQQLHAFMQLEIALGHTLDLIAVAEESGMRLGFAQLPPVGNLGWIVQHIDARLAKLGETLATMALPPNAEIVDLAAWVRPKVGDELQRRATVRWRLAEGAVPALIKITRRWDKARLKAFNADVLRCAGGTFEAAQTQAEALVEGLGGEPETVAELPWGRHQFIDEYTTPLDDFPREIGPVYEFLPLSAFGVPGAKAQLNSRYFAQDAAAPTPVLATPMAPDVFSGDFYRWHDAVRLEWQGASNDVAQEKALGALASDLAIPHVQRYRIFRISNGETSVVGHTQAGQTTWVDHVPEALLHAGVSYVVQAVSTDGSLGLTSPRCREPMVHPLGNDMLLARAGAGIIQSRAHIEAYVQSQLRLDGGTDAALAALAAFPEDVQQGIINTWWGEQPKQRRVFWLEQWMQLHGPQNAQAEPLVQMDYLRPTDALWAQLQLWLNAHEPFLIDEVERFWRLQDSAVRQQHISTWQAQLDSRHRAFVQARLQGGDTQVLWPARLLAWWQSRDELEQQEIGRWWDNEPQESRQRALALWLAEFTTDVRASLVWPQWSVRSAAQQESFLSNVPTPLPKALLPVFLAWFVIETAPHADVLSWVQAQQSPLGALWSTAVFALRPLDKALGFSGPAALLLLIVLVCVMGLGWRHRQRKQQVGVSYVRPLDAAISIGADFRAANDEASPMVVVPGTADIQNMQTLGGLLVVENAAQRSLDAGCPLHVLTARPFTQWLVQDLLRDSAAASTELLAPEPNAFAAGAMGALQRQSMVASLAAGGFGPEALLLFEPAAAKGRQQIAASATLSELPVMMASAQAVLMGEELYARAGYLAVEPTGAEGLPMLHTLDWLRYLSAGAMLLGAVVWAVLAAVPWTAG